MGALEEYVARLPAGLDSYPEAQAKGTVVRPWCLDPTVAAALRASKALPEAVRAMVDSPPTVSGWVPEVMLSALILAAFDAHFARAGGDDAVQAFIRRTNRAVMSGPLYAILFAVASPSRLLGGVAQRWAAFHRGSSLAVVEPGDKSAVLELTHPPQVFSTYGLRGHGTSFALAAELAGGRTVQMRCDAVRPEVTRYLIQWR